MGDGEDNGGEGDSESECEALEEAHVVSTPDEDPREEGDGESDNGESNNGESDDE